MLQKIWQIYIYKKDYHPLTVNIINIFKISDYLFFLMEYVNGITFRKYLNLLKRNNRDINELKFYVPSLACVLDYLQKKTNNSQRCETR